MFNQLKEQTLAGFHEINEIDEATVEWTEAFVDRVPKNECLGLNDALT